MLGEAGGEDNQLMELPLVSKQAAIGDDEMTEEMLLKKTEKNRKRRLAAQKRKEKRKVCFSLSLSLLHKHTHTLTLSLSLSPSHTFSTHTHMHSPLFFTSVNNNSLLNTTSYPT